MKKFNLIAALLAFSVATAVSAGDCPPPKKLTCEELKAKIAQRCKPEEVPKPKLNLEYMISGGIDLEKNILKDKIDTGWNVTGAMFIPVKRGSLAILAGEHYLDRDEASCPIGCKTCTVPAGSPWRTSINVGWKF